MHLIYLIPGTLPCASPTASAALSVTSYLLWYERHLDLGLAGESVAGRDL